MAKKQKQPPKKAEERSAADYYKLNTKAVDDLIHATEENSPPVSKEELRKYRAGGRLAMADWLKAVLLKMWFGGVVCYFIVWGLGMYVGSQLDLLVITGIALGFVTDLITNNIFRFIAKPKGANDCWMMFPKKNYVFLPLNVLYALLLVFCVVTTYNAINAVLVGFSGARDTVPLGVEPILFGVFTMGWDMLFLGCKRLARRMVSDAKASAVKNK
ncbi:MAG: hypothetical protein IJI53_06020 [Clostridia bacterium]|nr:hypothetical protein [Clostridia bacterium]MBR0407573.1 hypothetical protein [Clostridia bacterium]